MISEEFETSIELLSRTLRLYNFPRQLVAQEIKSIRDGETLIDLSPLTTIQTGDLLVMCGTKGQLRKAVEMVSSTGDLQ